MTEKAEHPIVLIVGGGFGGLAVAKGLRRAEVDIALVDRQNHHVFQPLLYQVATASLSPADISAPIRNPLKGQKNVRVVMAEAKRVDLANRQVFFDEGKVSYDYLVLATGATHDYFGHDHWADLAPGLKSLSDATHVRRRVLLAYEAAEHEADDESQRSALTFVVVGAGPTGVELAGAIMEVAAKTLPEEFRNIDTKATRVIIVEGQDRVLGSFPEGVSERALQDLEHLGVEVRLNTLVTEVTDDGVQVERQGTGEHGPKSEFIATHNAFWAAGVRASALGDTLGTPQDKAGRVLVRDDLTVPDHPNVFVIGDMASITPEGSKEPVPGVAQGALQMGSYVANHIRQETQGTRTPHKRKPFKYTDKGSMAIIGKNRAVAAVGNLRFFGFTAWTLWAVIHIAFIVGFRNRTRVLLEWFFNWLLSNRDARLIIGNERPRVRLPRGRGFKSLAPPPIESCESEETAVKSPAQSQTLTTG